MLLINKVSENDTNQLSLASIGQLRPTFFQKLFLSKSRLVFQGAFFISFNSNNLQWKFRCINGTGILLRLLNDSLLC
jgi:hypothetical protein